MGLKEVSLSPRNLDMKFLEGSVHLFLAKVISGVGVFQFLAFIIAKMPIEFSLTHLLDATLLQIL